MNRTFEKPWFPFTFLAYNVTSAIGLHATSRHSCDGKQDSPYPLYIKNNNIYLIHNLSIKTVYQPYHEFFFATLEKDILVLNFINVSLNRESFQTRREIRS